MVDATSGIKTPSRFFSFRWVYVLTTLLLWWYLLSFMFVEVDYVDISYSPSYLLYNFLGEFGFEGPAGQLDGVFGFYLYEDPYGWPYGGTTRSHLLPKMSTAGYLSSAVIAALAIAFVIPEAGKSKNLPATRGVHFRGKLATSFIVGLALTATLAGAIEFLQIDLITLFQGLGWLPSSAGPYGYGWNDFFPPSGDIVLPVSWIGMLTGTFLFGAIVFTCLSFIRLGRDRYWQAERWTLILTVCGALIVIASLFSRSLSYANYETFLGGAYTTHVVGLFLLTWAWTCRTGVFLMLMRYEKAANNSDAPACFACGYDLRMLTSNKCPECGTPVNAALLSKIQQLQANAETH